MSLAWYKYISRADRVPDHTAVCRGWRLPDVAVISLTGLPQNHHNLQQVSIVFILTNFSKIKGLFNTIKVLKFNEPRGLKFWPCKTKHLDTLLWPLLTGSTKSWWDCASDKSASPTRSGGLLLCYIMLQILFCIIIIIRVKFMPCMLKSLLIFITGIS